MPTGIQRKAQIPNQFRNRHQRHQRSGLRLDDGSIIKHLRLPSGKMNSTFNCPIIGCHHYPKGTGRKFSDLTHLIRHLKGNDHNKSRHLLDHTLCNKIKLYRCTHQDCRSNPNIFFPSKRALDDHNSHHHTPLCIPIPNTTLYQDNHTLPYDYTHPLFYTPGNENLTNNWNSGVEFILNNYDSPRPHFRSSWRRFLRGKNKTIFSRMLKLSFTMRVYHQAVISLYHRPVLPSVF